eukprot:196613_1
MANGDEIAVTVILCIVGLVPTFAGGFRFLSPISALLKGLGITLFKDEESYDVGLVNEITGTGGHLCAAGIVIVVGAFVEKLTSTSIIVAFIVFWGFAIARIFRMCFDGNPGKGVIQGLIIELVLGLLAIIAMVFHCKATDFCE